MTPRNEAEALLERFAVMFKDEDGAVHTDRPRVKAQGAALIAARPMFALERAGLVHFRSCRERRDGFVLTQAGADLLAAKEPTP